MRGGLQAIIHVPEGIMEWFITVQETQSGAEVFSDWTDHYTTTQQPMSEAELTDERVGCVITMLRVLSCYECRVAWSEGFSFFGKGWFRSKVLQAHTESGWKDVWQVGFEDNDR